MEKRYIQTFETSESLQEALDNNELGKPYVAYLEDEQRIDWNTLSPAPPAPDYSAMPLTFEIISDGNIVWKDGENDHKTIEYNKNNNGWTSITSTSAGVIIPVVTGDIIQFRGEEEGYGVDNGEGWIQGAYMGGTATTAGFKVYGNLMSMLNSGLTSFGYYGFHSFFSYCTGLTDASNLVMPTLRVRTDTYYKTFCGCESIQVAPDLPDVQINSTSTNSYGYMFAGCTSLNYIKCLISNPQVGYYTFGSWTGSDWTGGVSPTGTFVKHPDATWPSGENGIPTGWTVQDATI